MVRQDAHAACRPAGAAVGPAARAVRHDAVLLVGADQDEILERPAGEVAHQAVALVHRLLRACRGRATSPSSRRRSVIQPFSRWWPITVASTESAISSSAQTPMPAMTRSKKTKTPARTSVTPSRCSRDSAVGVEPTLTTGHGEAGGAQALCRMHGAARSCSAIARIASTRSAVVASCRHGSARRASAAAAVEQPRRSPAARRRRASRPSDGRPIDLDQHLEGRPRVPLRRASTRRGFHAVQDQRQPHAMRLQAPRRAPACWARCTPRTGCR